MNLRKMKLKKKENKIRNRMAAKKNFRFIEDLGRKDSLPVDYSSYKNLV